ncbi:MAG: glycosyltransferase family 39 protein [Elusimicrobiota bacterium]
MKKQYVYIFLAVLVAGSFLRLYGLKKKGLFLWDESYYSLEARTLYRMADWVFNKEKRSEPLKTYLINQGCILPTGVGKPGYIWPFSFISFLSGSKDYSGFLLSAAAGILSMMILFFIVKIFYSQSAAFFAFVLMAFSGTSIIYSRVALSNSLTILMLLAGVYVYIKSISADEVELKRISLAGLIIGYAYTCHYSLLPNIGLFILYEFVFLIKKRHFKRFAIFILSPLSFPVFFEIIYRGLLVGCKGALDNINYLTYFEYLIRQYTMVGSGNMSIAGLISQDNLFYIKRIINQENIIVMILTLAAYIYIPVKVLKKKRICDIVIYSQAVIVFMFWVFNPGTQVGRSIAVVIPFNIILISASMDNIINKKLIYKWPVIILLFLLVAMQIGFVKKIISFRSGYKAAFSYLKSQGSKELVVLHNWPVWQFYFNKKIYGNKDRIKNHIDLKNYAQKNNVRYYASDYNRYRRVASDLDVFIDENYKPVLRFPSGIEHSIDYMYGRNEPPFVYEIKNDKLKGSIRIYEINDIIKER